jgi:hypothetical protein
MVETLLFVGVGLALILFWASMPRLQRLRDPDGWIIG